MPAAEIGRFLYTGLSWVREIVSMIVHSLRNCCIEKLFCSCFLCSHALAAGSIVEFHPLPAPLHVGDPHANGRPLVARVEQLLLLRGPNTVLLGVRTYMYLDVRPYGPTQSSIVVLNSRPVAWLWLPLSAVRAVTLLHHACRFSLAAPPVPAAITAAAETTAAWAAAQPAAGAGLAAAVAGAAAGVGAGVGAGGLPRVCSFTLGQAGGRHRVRVCATTLYHIFLVNGLLRE